MSTTADQAASTSAAGASDVGATSARTGSSGGARRGSGRLDFLDAIRGVAALVVVIGHGSERLFDGYLRWQGDWFGPGRFGVCAFFLVSGFVIPRSIERGGGVRGFAIGRATRLYPLYWFSLAAILLASTVRPGALPTEFADALPGSAAVNVTMLQDVVRVPHAIGLYYTLTIELLWYVLCAVLFALGLLRRTAVLTAVALGGLAVVGVGVPLLAERHVPFASGFYLATMFVGTCFARHAAGQLRGAVLVAAVAGAAVVAGAGSWANYVHLPGAVDAHGRLGLFATLGSWAVAYAVFVAAYRWRSLAYPAALTWLGLISYSVYLLHPVVLPFAVGLPGGRWVGLAFLVGATLLIARLTQRWIEEPGQQLGRRLRARWAAPRPAP